MSISGEDEYFEQGRNIPKFRVQYQISVPSLRVKVLTCSDTNCTSKPVNCTANRAHFIQAAYHSLQPCLNP